MSNIIPIEMTPLSDEFKDAKELGEYLKLTFAENNVCDFEYGLSFECANIAEVNRVEQFSLFEQCCKKPGSSMFISDALKWAYRFDKLNELNVVNQHCGMSPINFVVQSGDVRNVRTLLECPAFDIDHRIGSHTSLHKLIIEMNNVNFYAHFELIKLLISHQADVNAPNEYNVPPVQSVAENDELSDKQKRDVLEYMLRHAKVNLDWFDDGEPRHVIRAMFPDLILPPILTDKDRQWNEQMLFDALRQKDEEMHFLFGWSMFKITHSPIELRDVLALTVGDRSMLTMAVSKGMIRAVELLLRSGADVHDFSSTSNEPVLAACRGGHHAILGMLMRSPKFDINRTALLFHVIFDPKRMSNIGDYNKCFDLLIANDKVDLHQRDEFEGTPLHRAVAYNNKHVINKLLDKSVYIGSQDKYKTIPIEQMDPDLLETFFDRCIRTNYKRPEEDNYQIVFNYSNLKPTEYKKAGDGPFDEMIPIKYIATTPAIQHLIKHPLIASFMHLKWDRFKKMFYLNFLLVLMYSLTFVPYVFFYYAPPYNADTNVYDGIISNVLYAKSIVGVLLIVLRELFQLFTMYLTRYFRQFSNWLEIALVSVSVCILCDVGESPELRKSIAVCAILLIFGEIFVLVGSLPILTLTTHFVMLRTVFFTIINYLQLYSIMLFAFALCFIVLFNEKANNPMDQFTNLGITMTRVLIMMTGEINGGDIRITFFFGYFLLAIYILLFTVSMFNLLTGLAVSDSQIIKDDAELTYFLHRYEMVAEYEHSSLHKHDHWYDRLFTNQMNLFPEYLPLNQIRVMVNKNNSIFIPSKSKVSFDFNEYKSTTSLISRLFTELFSVINMNKDITNYALAVLNRKPKEFEESPTTIELNERTLEMQKNVSAMMVQLSDVLARLNSNVTTN